MVKKIFFRFSSLLLKLFAFVIIFLAILLNFSHFIINLIPDKNQFVSAMATSFLGKNVSVDQVTLGGSAAHPVVRLSGVAVGEQQIKTIKVGVNLWESFVHQAWLTDHIFISDVDLHQHYFNGKGHVKSNDALINWLMVQPDIVFQHVQVRLIQKNKLPIQFKQLALRLRNNGDDHILAGNFDILHQHKTNVRFVLKLQAKNLQDQNAKGVFYVSGKHLLLPEWMALLSPYLPLPTFALSGGTANLSAWLHLSQRKLQSVQMKVNLQGLHGHLNQHDLAVTPLKLNLAWFPENKQMVVVDFSGSQATINLPQLFIKPLTGFNLKGQLVGYKHQTGWMIGLPFLKVADRNFNFHAKSTINFKKQSSPIVSFLGDFSFSDLAMLHHYLPSRIMKPKLLRWLDSAFISGGLNNGRILFEGPLRAFPFDHGEGRFEAFATIQNINLHFLKRWPSLSDLSGQLMFDDRGMRITAENAKLSNLPIHTIAANISNLSHPRLLVNASSHFDLGRGIAFAKQPEFDMKKDLNFFSGHGPVGVEARLEIPLYSKHGPPKFSGCVSFENNALNMPKWSLSLNDLSGRIILNNQMLSSQGLQAKLFNAPVHFSVKTKADASNKKAIAIAADGVVDIKHLPMPISESMTRVVRGSIPVHVGMLLHDVSSSASNTMAVSSSLKGLSLINVPEPFAKRANELWPSKLQLVMKKDGLIAFTSNIDKLLGVNILLVNDVNGLHLEKGRLEINGPSPRLPEKEGLFISGDLKKVDVPVWRRCVKKIFPDENNTEMNFALPNFLKGVDLSIDDLLFEGRHWQNLLLALSPEKKGVLVAVQNDALSGRIHWPNKAGDKIKGDFDYLFLPKNNRSSFKANKVDPAKLPPLSFHVDDFRVPSVFSGEITLVTKPINHGLVFQKIAVKNNLFSLHADGSWMNRGGIQNTTIAGKFDSDNLGEFLKDQHISSRLLGGVLSSRFSLNWLGAPNDFKLKNTDGQLSISLLNGRILQLNNETESNLEFGRFLNLLSLESVSKFFTFDFSSFTKKGFLFHTLDSDLIIKKGDMITKKMEVDGPIAHISVLGDIGLTSKKNNLYLTISPYFSSSLPVIVGLAGGPIAGITTWLVNKLVAPGVGHMVSMRYHVTGSWDHPVVKKEKTRKKYHVKI